MRTPCTPVACLLPALLFTIFTTGAATQTRSLVQDPALNNLRHPPGTATTPLGTLGRVRTAGTGSRQMLLIAGLGFGDDIWADFMERHSADYTMTAVTLPGFGDTPPLPMPADGTHYADWTWTSSTVTAIETLLDDRHIAKVTVVAHWALATQIALRLALDRPDRVDAVVLVGGVLKSYYDSTPAMLTWTAAQRSQFADGMGQQWFKTVTRRTWDDNNFMSYDYAVNPRRGLFLWREAQVPSLPVWIRYLLEFYAIDLSSELPALRAPTLVVQPGFDDPAFYVDDNRDYMRNLCLDSWRGAEALSRQLEFVVVHQSRLFVMHDQPAALDAAMTSFLGRVAGRR